MSPRRLTLSVFVTALATLALSVPASAAKSRALEASFGPDGTATTAFERPAAVGVDQSTGQIYVEDAQAGTVQRFNSTHEPEPFTGLAPNIKGGVLTGFSFSTQFPLSQLAVDSTSHDVYVVVNNATPPSSLRAFQSDGEPVNFTAGPGAGTNEIGGFAELCGVAVDSNGDIYASDYVEGVQVYAPSGEHITTIANTVGQTFCNAAVDSNGALYLNHFAGAVEKFTPSVFPVTSATTYTGPKAVDKNSAAGIAVDQATDHLLVDEHTQVAEYEETGALTFSFGALTLSEGLAVNSVSGRTYVSDAKGEHRVQVFGHAVTLPEVKTGEASEIKPSSATLNGTVNPEGVEVTDCHFDYGTTTAYGHSVACVETVGSGSGEVAVHAEVTGLTPGTTYHFRLQATSEGTAFGADATFSTLPPPAITAPSTTSITETSATLNAKINSKGSLVTSCQFEYGTEAGVYPSKLTCTPPPGSGSLDVPVTARIEPLKPNVTYHWRVVASSEAGTTTSPDQTFIDDTTGAGLPDHRAYELVTPAQKNEALINEFVLGGIFPQIARDGQRVIAGSVQCFAGPESCRAVRFPGEGEPFEFSRTAGGWVTHPLAPPTSFETDSLWTLSADAGTTLFSVPRVPPSVVEEDFYGRDEHGSFVNVGPVGEHASRTSVSIVESTGDLSHVLYQTSVGSVWSFDLSSGPRAVYEYAGTGNATPLMVGVSGGLENGHNHKLIGTCGIELGGASQMSKENGSLSEDGRTVYFAVEGHNHSCTEPTSPPARELYARIDGELPAARSVLISGPTLAACTSTECHNNTTEEASARDANFEGASADGSRALFTDTQQLSDHASEDPNPLSTAARGCTQPVNNTPGTGGCNLYESVCPGPCGKVGEEPNASNRELIDVSEGPGGAPVAGGPRVQGVVGISADGSHVYFVAKGILAGAEQNQSHEAAEDEKENLYVYERDEAHPQGRLAFVARLALSDKLAWGEGGSANVTSDGRFLVLTSHRALTADATCVEGEAETPVCPAQVFEYDAQTRRLVRVSIGEKGFNDNGNGGVLGEPRPSAPELHFGDARVAEPGRGGGGVPLRLDPTMSDDGAFVFFQSPVALTPGALNDVSVGEQFAQNVYEYHEGHVSLISDGKDATHQSHAVVSPVELLGSDASGANVFFTTFDQLVSEDSDTQRDIYDAHICSETEPCSPPRPAPTQCEGEACHGAPSPSPVFGAPASVTLTGTGNVAPSPVVKGTTTKKVTKCKKGFAKKRGKCIKNKSKRKAKKAKRASNDRRTRR